LNSTNPSRPDFVSQSEPTDRHFVSIGCASLFLNYLAHQLNFPWPRIISALAPTLDETAQNLNPCSDIQNELDDLSPGDFLNLQEYEKAVHYFQGQLRACVRGPGRGLQNPFADFAALLAKHFPVGTPAHLKDDNPFPLSW
jgi:hypothetical protein